MSLSPIPPFYLYLVYIRSSHYIYISQIAILPIFNTFHEFRIFLMSPYIHPIDFLVFYSVVKVVQ